jgi:hypothetical protein
MGFIGADGKYYSGTPQVAKLVQDRTTVWKQSDHDRQRQDHQIDLIKPFNPDGTPNEAFIDNYREESIDVYKFIKSDEEISKER